MVVVGEASSGEAALELVAQRGPKMSSHGRPGCRAWAASRPPRAIATEHRDVRVQCHGPAEQDLLWEALDTADQGLRSEGLRQLRAGGRDPQVQSPATPTSIRGSTDWAAGAAALGGILSREREILQMLADGHSNREVSEQLVVSVETVKTHVKHILAKLEAEHRTQAVAMGFRQALIR